MHRNGVPTTFPSKPGVTTFDDSDPNRYYDATNPWASTKVAGSGTTIRVQNHAAKSMKLVISFK